MQVRVKSIKRYTITAFCCLSVLLSVLFVRNVRAEGEANVAVCGNSDEYVAAIAAMVRDYGNTATDPEDGGVRLHSVRSSAFGNRRLLVRADALSETYGAVAVIRYGDQYVLQYETEADTRQAYDNLLTDGQCSEVSPDEPVKLAAGDTTQTSWGITKMGLNTMRSKLNERGGYDVVVAVLDSGIDVDNEIFAGRLLPGVDCTGETTDAQDGLGHGTEVASIIAAGTPDNIKIIPVKVTDSRGNASSLMIKAGMEYAISQGVDIANLSLGARPSTWLDSEIQRATDAGMVIVAAAGNEGLRHGSTGAYTYPADHDLVIAVSAINAANQLASFSNYGAFIDYCAPGASITCSKLGGGTGVTNGTSIATPHVTAAFADIMCANGVMNTDEIISFVDERYVTDIGVTGKDVKFGKGMIDLTNFNFYDEPEDPEPTLGNFINIAIASKGNLPKIRKHEKAAEYSEQ